MPVKQTEAYSLPIPAGNTVTVVGPDIVNHSARGLKVVLSTTVIGTGSVTVIIEGKAKGSGLYYTLLSGAAVVTNVVNVYTVYPGLTAAANVTATDVLPETFRVRLISNNANAVTATCDFCTLL